MSNYELRAPAAVWLRSISYGRACRSLEYGRYPERWLFCSRDGRLFTLQSLSPYHDTIATPPAERESGDPYLRRKYDSLKLPESFGKASRSSPLEAVTPDAEKH
jgi:hypothetical protein